ncbi:hypothetical protein D9M70_501950 [compost metagenome]
MHGGNANPVSERHEKVNVAIVLLHVGKHVLDFVNHEKSGEMLLENLADKRHPVIQRAPFANVAPIV